MAAPAIAIDSHARGFSSSVCHRRVDAIVATDVITICHPVWQLARGGLERQLLQTIENLPRNRFRHVLVVRGWDEESVPCDQAPCENVEIVRQPGAKKDRLWPIRLASVLRDHAVDVLHVRGLTMLLDALVATRLGGDIALALSFHGFERANGDLSLIRREMYRAAASRCDDRWAVSRAAADTVAQALRMAPDQFGVLPNGVDTLAHRPSFCPGDIRKKLGLPQDRMIILSVGNLKPVKGHDVLLKAVRELRDEADRIAIVLVGRDYLDGTMQRWAREHLPDFDVRFVGRKDEPLSWYQAADLFVLPSRWEGMSNALLEAMACELPVIATAVGGNQEVVDHGHTGLMVESDDPFALARAIRRLIKDEPRRTALARAGRRLMQEDFAAPIAAAGYERRIRRLVRARRGGAR